MKDQVELRESSVEEYWSNYWDYGGFTKISGICRDIWEYINFEKILIDCEN